MGACVCCVCCCWLSSYRLESRKSMARQVKAKEYYCWRDESSKKVKRDKNALRPEGAAPVDFFVAHSEL